MNALTLTNLPAGVTLIALTGRRHQGKSTAAAALKEMGFIACHAFEAGKRMAETYFAYVTGDREEANRMVYGDLKEAPHVRLPLMPDGVTHASPRYFMERFGEFMGIQMGTPWTLEMEIALLVEAGETRIVVESLIYEPHVIHRLGGKIIRMIRTDGYVPPNVESDEVQEAIMEHHAIRAPSAEEALVQLHRYLETLGIISE